MLDPLAGAALASVGHVVVAPDYLGMNGMGAPAERLHSYVISEPTALASLDALRAGRQLVELLQPEVRPSAMPEEGTLVLGGSQGGHAAFTVGWYGPYYLPEEPVVAIAASVAPLDGVGETIRATGGLGGNTASMVGFLAAYSAWYGLDLGDVLRAPFDTSVPEFLADECMIGDMLDDATAPEQVFTTAFLDAAASDFNDLDDTWSCLINANSIVHQPLEPLSFPPTLVMLAGDDDLVDTPLQRVAFDSLCARGLPLQYLECEGVTHTQGALASLPEQLAFLKARWEGQPWPDTDQCVRTPPVTCSGEVDLP